MTHDAHVFMCVTHNMIQTKKKDALNTQLERLLSAALAEIQNLKSSIRLYI